MEDQNNNTFFNEADNGLMGGEANGNREFSGGMNGETGEENISKEGLQRLGARIAQLREEIEDQNKFTPTAPAETAEPANAEEPLKDAFSEAGLGSNQ